MQISLLKKGLVLGILILFIEAGAISSLGGMITEMTSSATIDSLGYIQDLIDNANDGDTINIPSGTYYENIVIDKSINLIGEDIDTTIINGGGSGYVVEISADYVNISRFTIENGGEWGITTSSYNTITNNLILNNEIGVKLGFTRNTSVSDNTISNNQIGIEIGDSVYNTVANNIISDNSEVGIYIGYQSNYNIIDDNYISNSVFGVSIFGLEQYPILDTVIVNNSFFNTGLFDFYINNNIVMNNTVNGKPLVYLKGESNKIIDTDAGQIILFVCDNITIQNQQLCNTTYGIILGYSTNCLILNNTINSNNMGGINIQVLSNDNTINGNTIYSNKREGIWIYNANNNTITGNTISSNNRSGIEFSDNTDNNIITNNTIYSNIVYGISLSINSIDNIIYHNIFIDNVVNANDEGDNIWDNDYPSGGNFWDDYNGIDINEDGIGDTPYPIPDGYNEDRYPLGNFKPYTPVIEGIRRFKEGEGGQYPYIIHSTDPEEDDICYLINWSDGTEEITGYYASGKEITINITIPSEKGIYNIFKIKAKDIFGAESDWAILEVTVPRNKATTYSLFQLLFDRFPFLEVFLRAMNLLR